MPVYKIALTIIVSAFVFGCASPNTPIPRHPTVPMPVGDLSARQVGDTMILNFTLPTTSTDLQPLMDIPSVEVYRNAPQTAAPAAKSRAENKSTARLVDTIPSEMIEQYRSTSRIEFPDKLNASDLSAESGTDLTYTVRTRVSRGKASADSNAVTARVYPPPATVQSLRVTLTETALVLDWSAVQSAAEAGGGKSAGFHIYRAEVDPTTAEAADFRLRHARCGEGCGPKPAAYRPCGVLSVQYRRGPNQPRRGTGDQYVWYWLGKAS